MKRYVYPAIFIKDEEDGSYKVLFPDLEVTTDGQFMEEAYLYAQELLKSYFVYVVKYDFDYNLPSDFEKIKKFAQPGEHIMLVSADITKKDIV